MRKRFDEQISVLISGKIGIFLHELVQKKQKSGLSVTRSDIIREALWEYYTRKTKDE